jgi:urease accessory protein
MHEGQTMSRPAFLTAVLLTLAATSAQAHTGVGVAGGFVHGFAHPIGGLDHVLTMIAVGIFAARLGGRALVLMPLSFISMMIVGGAIGMAGIGLPLVEIGLVEIGIGLSVVVLGLCSACGYRVPVAVAMAVTAIFALFHGHSHGAEMPEALSGLRYAAGFVVGTSLLHAIGIGIGLAPRKLGEVLSAPVLRMTGSVIALAGIAILTGNL